MPDHAEIYSQHADRYDLLVTREDYQQNISRMLNRIRPLDGLDVVELGAGTGRLTRMLAPLVKTIQAFDASQHMLDVAAAKLTRGGFANWRVAVADHSRLPVGDGVAGLVVSGWSICYAVHAGGEFREDAWHTVLAELKRVLRPGGKIVILETLGTGHDLPSPPEDLRTYYRSLDQAGFSSTWIRTDYRFRSPAEAEALTRFFFGDRLADRVVAENLVILPECTGIWWLTV